MFTDEEKGFIQVVELALDWNLYIPEEYLQRYYNLIERQVNTMNDDKLHCFICRLKQHFKETYSDGFYKTLENQINKILKDMESENNGN